MILAPTLQRLLTNDLDPTGVAILSQDVAASENPAGITGHHAMLALHGRRFLRVLQHTLQPGGLATGRIHHGPCGQGGGGGGQ